MLMVPKDIAKADGLTSYAGTEAKNADEGIGGLAVVPGTILRIKP